jgi:ABC-type sugar transport system substrate-binding protein
MEGDALRVLYVSPMEYGDNPCLDAVSHAIDNILARAGISLRVAYADFRDEDWLLRTGQLIAEGVKDRVNAIMLYTIDPAQSAEAVADARRQGVPVITLGQPHYDVDASLVYPNFNQGLYMAEYLSRLLPPRAQVGVVGGPGTPDDAELVTGIVHGLARHRLILVNDPGDPRYRNVLDVRPEGKEKVANLLADFPSLDALVLYDDETALGALDTLAETGRLGDLKTVSCDGTPKLVELVKDGLHHGTWDPDTIGIGRAAAQLAFRLLVHKEPLGGLRVAGPIGQMITPDLAAQWLPWERRIQYRPLQIWQPD